MTASDNKANLKVDEKDKLDLIILFGAGLLVVGTLIYFVRKNPNKIQPLNSLNPKTMKTIKFFVPIVWTLLALYIISFLFDLMNTANSMAAFIGLLSTILIVYLSYKYRLGLTLFTKNKTN